MATVPGDGKQTDVVELTFKSDDELRRDGGRGVFDTDGIKMLAQLFDQDEIAQLQALEPKIVAWIRQDPKNAVAYFNDPFGCLVHVELVSDPALLAKLRRLAELVKSLPNPAAIPIQARLRIS